MKVKDYTVFDIETPNKWNASISSISIVQVKDNKVIFKKEYLINPEDSFDDKNIEMTKITPLMVKDAPTFDCVWNYIKDFFTNGIVVGHNIKSFDLNVIAKVLNKYNIDVPDIYFIDTLNVCRELFTNIDNFKQETLCKKFGIINEQPHNSLWDAISNQKLFEKILEISELDDCDIEKFEYFSKERKIQQNQIDKSINKIYGIIKGITADKKLKELEIRKLNKWIEENEKNINTYPFDNLIVGISEIIEDNIVTEEEKVKFLDLSNKYISKNSYSEATLAMQVLMGILEGIVCDNELNLEEMNSLKEWMKANDILKGNYPFDKIYSKLIEILDDNVLTESESSEMMKIIKEFINPSYKEETKNCISVDYKGKNVCLTGNFSHGSKNDISRLIEEKGGIILSNVTLKLDILIVGGEGSKDWNYGNFGSKVKKAMELQEKGKNIIIISEQKFFEEL